MNKQNTSKEEYIVDCEELLEDITASLLKIEKGEGKWNLKSRPAKTLLQSMGTLQETIEHTQLQKIILQLKDKIESLNTHPTEAQYQKIYEILALISEAILHPPKSKEAKEIIARIDLDISMTEEPL